MIARIQPPITRRLLLPLWATMTGSPYVRYLGQLRQEQWDSSAKHESRTLHRLRQMLQAAYDTTDYYRRVFDREHFRPADVNSLSDIKRLPVMTKAEIHQYGQEMISRKHDRRRLIKNSTGGSTGTPVTIYTTPHREVLQAATTALNYEWAGLRLGDRLAMLWGSPIEQTTYAGWKSRLQNAMLGRLFLPTFTLSDSILGEYVQAINRFQPKVLLGYTSSLRALADFLERSQAHLPSVKSVISGAETLFADDRARFERTFRAVVFNRYGGRDSGAVAAECPEAHTMHLNTNIVLTEVVDGRIIVTDLWNEGMPIIRYDTGDIGVMDLNPCRCGRGTPSLKNIQGRINDLLFLPNGQLVPGEFFPHLFKDAKSVASYQIIQPAIDTLEMNIVPQAGGLRDQDRDYLETHIRKIFTTAKIKTTIVTAIPRLPSGKHRFTITHVHPRP